IRNFGVSVLMLIHYCSIGVAGDSIGHNSMGNLSLKEYQSLVDRINELEKSEDPDSFRTFSREIDRATIIDKEKDPPTYKKQRAMMMRIWFRALKLAKTRVDS